MKMDKKLAGETWILGNEEDATSVATLGLWVWGALREIPKAVKSAPLYHVFEFEKGHMRWFVPEQHTFKVVSKILNKVLASPAYYAKFRKNLVAASDRLYHFSNSLGKLDLASTSDTQLLRLIKQHELHVHAVLGHGLASAFMEVPYSQFTKHAQNLLEQRVKELNLKEPVVGYFHKLSAITESSIQRDETKDLYILLRHLTDNTFIRRVLQRGKSQEVKALAADPQINKLLQKHLAKYASAYYGYIGPAMTAEHLLTNLQLLVAEGKDPYDQLRRLNKEFQQVLADRKKTEQALRLTPKEKYVFKALRDTIFMKLYRRDSISHSFHMMEPIIREYARRAGLSYEEATHIAPGEYPKMLKNKTAQRQLKHRLIYCVIPGVRKSSRQLEVLHGQKARKYIKNLYQEQSWGDLKEVQGQVACVGKNTLMRGTVKIVNVPADMKKMQVGDILVSQATSPEIVSAMKKAAAIVTEQGGITSHASIVSRELNIACVIGTKIATQIFKDGDKVEVNTNTGLVSKI